MKIGCGYGLDVGCFACDFIRYGTGISACVREAKLNNDEIVMI